MEPDDDLPQMVGLDLAEVEARTIAALMAYSGGVSSIRDLVSANAVSTESVARNMQQVGRIARGQSPQMHHIRRVDIAPQSNSLREWSNRYEAMAALHDEVALTRLSNGNYASKTEVYKQLYGGFKPIGETVKEMGVGLLARLNPGSIYETAEKYGLYINKAALGDGLPHPHNPEEQSQADGISNQFSIDSAGRMAGKVAEVRTIYRKNPFLLGNRVLCERFMNAIGEEHFTGAVAPIVRDFPERLDKAVNEILAGGATLLQYAYDRKTRQGMMPPSIVNYVLMNSAYAKMMQKEEQRKAQELEQWIGLKGQYVKAIVKPRKHIREKSKAIAALDGKQFIFLVLPDELYENATHKLDEYVLLYPLQVKEFAAAQSGYDEKHKTLKALKHSDAVFCRTVDEVEVETAKTLSNAKRKLELDF